MKAVLDEADEIVAAAFGSLSTLAVNGEDPLTATITVKNNTLTSGTREMVGFLLGTYDAGTGSFSCLGITISGVVYLVGCSVADTVPGAGASKDISVPTYAVDVGSAMTLDALAFLMPEPSQLRAYGVDWGKGTRVLGIHKDDFFALQSTILAAKAFTGVVTISPKPTPQTPADLTNFQMGKL